MSFAVVGFKIRRQQRCFYEVCEFFCFRPWLYCCDIYVLDIEPAMSFWVSEFLGVVSGLSLSNSGET